MRRGVGLALVCAGAALGAHAAEPVVLYTRATPIEMRTGVVEIRTVQEALADVPVDCAGADPRSFGCTSGQRFARVYGLAFALERREARGDFPRVDAESRGEAYLFLRLERDDLAAFDDELRSRLSGLAADAFVDEYAGLTPGAEVFSHIARQSPEPSWSCFEHGSSRAAAEYKRETAQDEGGKKTIVRSGTTTYNEGPAVDPLCVTGPTLVRAAVPDEVRTTPSARALREETVLVEIVDQLSRGGGELLPLPDGLTYTTRKRPGVRSSASRQSRDGRVVKASFTKGEVEVGAEVTPVAFPPHFVAAQGWIAEWTVETVDRELGVRPTEKRGQAIVLRTALVPTRPPTPVDDDGQPTATATAETLEPRFDDEAYLGEIASRLDRVARLDGDTLARVIVEDPAGLGSQGFVLFICRERSATFEILPTGAGQQVTNAGELCAAIDRALD